MGFEVWAWRCGGGRRSVGVVEEAKVAGGADYVDGFAREPAYEGVETVPASALRRAVRARERLWPPNVRTGLPAANRSSDQVDVCVFGLAVIARSASRMMFATYPSGSVRVVSTP